MSHVTDAEISLFVSGRLTGKERRRVVRHLLTACPACLAKTAPYAAVLEGEEPELSGFDETIYEPVLDRVFAAVLRQTAHHETEGLCRDWMLAELRARKLESFGEVADGMDWLTIPGRAHIETLLALSFEARYRDPAEMRLFAMGAMVAAVNLGKEADQGRYSPAETADLQARACAELANAHRRNEDFSFAEESLAEAAAYRARGTGDPLLAARLLDVLASLRIDQRHLEEASALLDQVFELYQEAGETHLAGRALVSKGIGIHYDDKPEEAVGVLREGLALLDGQKDPQLLANGQQTLFAALVTIGEFGEANKLCLESRLREVFAAEPLNLLKVRWAEGRMFAGLGELLLAESLLNEVEEGFLAAGLDYEAALAGLERAGVLLQMGRTAEVRGVAEEALATFRALEVSREAVRAVVYLREACLQETVTAGVVRQVIRFLERLQRKPYLRFLPP